MSSFWNHSKIWSLHNFYTTGSWCFSPILLSTFSTLCIQIWKETTEFGIHLRPSKLRHGHLTLLPNRINHLLIWLLMYTIKRDKKLQIIAACIYRSSRFKTFLPMTFNMFIYHIKPSSALLLANPWYSDQISLPRPTTVSFHPKGSTPIHNEYPTRMGFLHSTSI